MSFSQRHTHIAKGIGILLLLYYHMFIDFSDYHSFLALIAHSCVSLFVFLSAFGLTISLDKAYSSKTREISWMAKHVYKLEVFFWPHYLVGIIIFYAVYKRSLLAYYGNIGKVLLDFFCVSDMLGMRPLLGVWWYMGLAICVVLVLVLFAKAYNKLGLILIPVTYVIMIVAPAIFRTDGFDNPGPYKGYLLAVCLGVFFARNKFFENYIALLKKQSQAFMLMLTLLFLLVITGLTFVLLFVRGNYFSDILMVPQLVKTINAVLFVFLSVNLAELKITSRVFEFLGKLSDDMFIFHVALTVAFPPITRLTGIPEVNYLIFLAASILISMAFKKLKALSRYDKLMDKLYGKININIGRPKTAGTDEAT